MPLELLGNRPVEEGFHIVFLYINDITQGLFMKFLLVTIWVIVTFGLYFGGRNLTGKGDFSMSIAVSGFVLTTVTILFRLVPGLISGWVLGTVLIVAVISIIWFLSTKNE